MSQIPAARQRRWLTVIAAVAGVLVAAACTSQPTTAATGGSSTTASAAPGTTGPSAATSSPISGTATSAAISAPTSSTAPDSSTDAAPSATSAGPTASGDRQPDYVDSLRPKIEKALQDNGVPGAVVLVRSPEHGDWTAAFGTRTVGGGDPVTVEDSFRLADITATMTATVILQLQQQGKLKLSEPISKYVAGVPGGDRITLEQLGDYSSGLFSYDQDPGFIRDYLADPKRVWTPQQLLDIAFRHPSLPAGQEGYSNTNWILLGLVIEKITGSDVQTVFQRQLFDPLGLKNIGMSDAAGTLPDPHPQGYAFARNPMGDATLPAGQRAAALAGTLEPIDRTAESTSWAWTAGAAYGTASDVADYFEGVVTGPLLDDASRQGWKNGMDSIGPDIERRVRYGFGMATYEQYLFYSGAMPGFNALVASAPAEHNTIVVLTNLMWTPSGNAPQARIFEDIKAALGDGPPTGG